MSETSAISRVYPRRGLGAGGDRLDRFAELAHGGVLEEDAGVAPAFVLVQRDEVALGRAGGEASPRRERGPYRVRSERSAIVTAAQRPRPTTKGPASAIKTAATRSSLR